MDPFFRNFSGWTEPIHWVLVRNFRKVWLNGSRPLFLRSPKGTPGTMTYLLCLKLRPKIPGSTSRKIRRRGVQHASWNPYPIADQNLWLYGRFFFSFPSCTALSLFLSPQSPYNTKRPLRRSHCKKRSYSIVVTRTIVFHLQITSFLGSNHFTMRLTANNLMIFFEALEDLLVEH